MATKFGKMVRERARLGVYPMPSSHVSLHVHIVFSTKDRVRIIRPSWQERLHEYLGGTINQIGGVPEKIGGVEDHVHLLVGLPSTLALADLVRDMKANSSHWVHDEIGESNFAWQEGYGAFSVSPDTRDRVRNYIANQAKHHRRKSFQEEYLGLLKKAGVEYDEKYLW